MRGLGSVKSIDCQHEICAGDKESTLVTKESLKECLRLYSYQVDRAGGCNTLLLGLKMKTQSVVLPRETSEFYLREMSSPGEKGC